MIMVANAEVSKYFKAHTMSDLKMVARLLNISGYSNKKKADLIDLIKSQYLQYDILETRGKKLLEVSRVLKAYIPKEPNYEVNHVVQLKKK